MLTGSVLERFEVKIDNLGEADVCWRWNAGKFADGYGTFKLNGRMQRSHRVSYEHWVEPIPEGLVIDHLCRVIDCVNPAHLEVVTRRENTLRGSTLAAAQIMLTHCRRGHSLSGKNVRTPPGTRKRVCITCGSEAVRIHRRKRKAELSV